MLTRTVYFLLDLPKKIKTKNIIEPLHNPQSSDSDIGAFKVQKIISHLNFFLKYKLYNLNQKKRYPLCSIVIGFEVIFPIYRPSNNWITILVLVT